MTRCVTSVLLIVGGWHGRVWAAMPERLSGRVAWPRLGGHAGTLERSMSAQGRGHATGRIKTLGDGPPARRLTDQRSVPQAALLGALRDRHSPPGVWPGGW